MANPTKESGNERFEVKVSDTSRGLDAQTIRRLASELVKAGICDSSISPARVTDEMLKIVDTAGGAQAADAAAMGAELTLLVTESVMLDTSAHQHVEVALSPKCARHPIDPPILAPSGRLPILA